MANGTTREWRAGLLSLSERQTISSLPPGFAGSSFGSEILGSRDGRFVYAGNRLHDSIAIFAVGKTGELTVIGEEWTHGDYPRSFNFDPTGSYLDSCNQRADNLTAFRVHRRSGRLAFTGHGKRPTSALRPHTRETMLT